MTFAKPSSRPRLWRRLRGLPHHTNIHRERRPAGLLLRGILKIKGKEKEVRGKGKGAHGKNVGDVPLWLPHAVHQAHNMSGPMLTHMQPYGTTPAVVQNYPAPPSILPPQ